MRTVIQRVKKASVRVGESEVSSIGPGLLLLLGIEAADTEEDILWLCHKILGLRIFDDEEGVMNKSIMDVNGEGHEHAVPMYKRFVEVLSEGLGKPVGTGVFGAEMQVELINDGPVTICMDTKNRE